MIEFERSPGPTPPKGKWTPILRAKALPSALLACPTCGSQGSLHDHDISSEGHVTPSVVCSQEGCTFHDYAKLTDWPPR